MKKFSLLSMVAAMLFGGSVAAQTVLIQDDLEEYTVGNKLAAEAIAAGHDWWTTWNQTSGGSNDGEIADAYGSKTVKFTANSDQVLLLGDRETGVYDVEFDMYTPTGNGGYFNLLHAFPASSNEHWAIQVYVNMTSDGQNATYAPGHGTVHAGSNGTFDLPCVLDEWMHFRVHVNCDTDIATLYFNGEEIGSWQWSLDSFGENPSTRVLAAMNFCSPSGSGEFYADNFVFTTEGGEQELIGESFEEYTVGGKIAQSAIAAGHDWWTTWNNNPGGSNDGTVSNDYASEGSNSGYFTSASDQVLLLGGYETGVYDLSFDVYTATGKDGYFNLLHNFAGSDSDWAMQVYINAEADAQNSSGSQVHSTGHGTVFAGGGAVADVPCVENEWMNFRIHIDCDNDVATLYYNEGEIWTWQWSVTSFGDPSTRVIDGANFYGPLSSSQFYVDNIHFTKIGGESAPELSITPESVDETLDQDEMTSVAVTIENSGNSIGDWAGWLEFGEGGTGSQTAELFYHNGEVGIGIGSSDAYTREMGIRLPANAYAGAAMGMRIVSAKYYIYDEYASADHNYIFRIYGQGLHNQPGELLAEKTVNSTQMGTWITATFDQPVYMTGQAMWVTVQLEQVAGEYPLSMDGGEYGEEADGNWLRTNGGNFSHCYSAGSFGGAWLITVNCQGELIPATWASIDKNEGSIMGGQSDVINLSLNTIGMEQGVYNASLIIFTNDEELPYVEIPVTLRADYDAIAENSVQLASIYPNPATTSITLEGEDLSSVAIYNVAGQLIRIEKLGSVVNTINLDVEAGVYFFSVYDTNGNNSVQRVVITK